MTKNIMESFMEEVKVKRMLILLKHTHKKNDVRF